MTRYSIALFISVLFLLTSCFKEIADDLNNIDNLTWNPTLALPLANGSFTIDEFTRELSGDNFSSSIRPDGLVVFHYHQDQAFSQTAEELVDIQDENYNTTVRPSSGSLPNLPVTGTITQVELHEFNVDTPENDLLYTASIKGGRLEIDLNGNFPASGELTLTFPGLTKDGTMLQTTFQWNYDGSNNQQFLRTIELAGYEFDFTDNGSTSNYIHFNTTLTLNYEGQAVTTTEGIDLNLDLRALEFSKATATVSRRVVSTETGEFTFNFLDELAGGVYYFDEPAINFHFRNGFGVPLEATIIGTTAHSISRGDLSLTGNVVGNPFSMGYPTIEEIGTVVETDITINHENSNLPQMIAWQPNTISYEFEGVVNPSSNNDVHFVLDTSTVSANIDLELPMIGRFRNLVLTQNYDFTGEELDEVEYALFRLHSSNGFPINANIQLYFRDGNGLFIDSLIYDDQQVLEAGLTDNIGKVTAPTVKDIDILVPKDRLGPISQAQRLFMRAKLDTPENDTRSVRIYAEDRLSVKLYVQTQFEINL